MSDIVTFAVAWGASTAILTFICYRIGIQAIPRIMTRRATSAIRNRGVPLNVLLLRPMNDAENCRIPMAIADALTSIAVYDLSKSPVRITATMPADTYWSLSCYADNTDNFFVINDLEVRKRGTDQISVVLLDESHDFQAEANELAVTANSQQGVILIRMIVPDQSDPAVITQLVKTQEQACVAEVDPQSGGEQSVYRVLATTHHGETHVRVVYSESAVNRLKSGEYASAKSVRVIETSPPAR